MGKVKPERSFLAHGRIDESKHVTLYADGHREVSRVHGETGDTNALVQPPAGNVHRAHLEHVAHVTYIEDRNSEL